MKKRIFLLLLLSPLFMQAKTIKQENDSLLTELDKAIANSETYVQQKTKRLDELKQMLRTPQITPEQQYDIHARLSNEYKPFILDSAIHYTRQNVRIAKEQHMQEQYYESALQLARLYSITTLFVEAADLLREIPVGKLPPHLRIQYYDTYKCFFNYYSHDIDGYADHCQTLRDTLMSLYDKDNNGYKMLYVEQLLLSGNTKEAQHVLSGILNEAPYEDGWRAVVAYLTGDSYVPERNYEMQIKYFAQSAIADVKNAIKENMSLRALALALYNTGEIDRAYRYIQKSMEDAIFCNAQLRTMEVSQIFPIIDQAQQAKNEQQKRNLRILNICILILSFFLIAAVIYVYLQMQKLSKAQKNMDQLNRELREANDSMLDINLRLQESNALKEEYIARYMNEASNYLDKLEEYRRTLNHLAKNGKMEELYKTLKSDKLMEEELQNFYVNFDQSFLQLFPNFITEFNALLHEEDRIIPKQKELLNTELRIFALIRLGITDSNRIAHFLRYPVRTIYNYRTKVRNKASGIRGELEENVMKIGVRQSTPKEKER